MEDTFSTSNAAPEDMLQVVVFQLADEEFGIDIMSVKEIIRIPELVQIPQSPDYVEGVVNIRGDIIVALNISNIFNIENKENDHNSRIIVTELEDITVGIMVDSVSEVLRIPYSDIDPAPAILLSGKNSECVEGVGKLDDRLLLLIDSKKILGKDEQLSIVESGYQEMVPT
ncbi:MAG: purine-binding chemotaxis protein CheW [Methanolobus sp.]|jgi:purine-binding chemotaxis protein CheW|nr:purine-binding chemotaxis protein CheW [Methanolobus sp.]